MWHHPKYYKELAKKRKELERQQANKPTSQQADEPTSEQADKPASDQASSGSRINKRWMWSQSLIAREGVSR